MSKIARIVLARFAIGGLGGAAYYQVRTTPDSFSFYCSGHNHGTLVPAGFPQYNAETGWNDHP